MKYLVSLIMICTMMMTGFTLNAQIGKRFPSEKKVIKDPFTGTMLTFLTSSPNGDSKIYQTHNQWTSDGKYTRPANRTDGQTRIQ